MSEEFARLFRGRTDAFGTGRGGVVRNPDEGHIIPAYQNHLAGRDSGLGIFPMLDDDTCWFGAIDLDEPNFDLARAMQLLIPGRSWIERSRSGNAHIWVFFDAPCPAWAVRAVLKNATEAVGRRDVEIFPKQDQLREGMVGNYINLPYHGDDRPILRDVSMSLVSYTRDDFVARALANLQDPAAWERRARHHHGAVPPAEREETSEWGEQTVLHECAAYIIEGILSGDRPIKPGARHQVMFCLAKQLLNYEGFDRQESWDLLAKANNGLPRPLPESELERTFRNAVQGRFTSTGCDDPLMSEYVHPDCTIADL